MAKVAVVDYMNKIGQAARAASRELARADTHLKNNALEQIAEAVLEHKTTILAANKVDMDRERESGLESALLDRLEITEARFADMIDGVKQVAALADPIGEIADLTYRPSGIQLGKMRVPLGVVGIIYESRPNVTLDAASLCLKSGNACILRGGKEAIESNKEIASAIKAG